MTRTISTQVLSTVVGLACRAPSVHNSQPWQWVFENGGAEDGVLRRFLAEHRIPHATDRTGRESVISCGAALDHLRVAATAAGWRTEIARFPNPNDLTHLATVEFTREEFVTDADRARADAILDRRTDRLPFYPPQGWAVFEPMLRSTIDPDSAMLYVLNDAVRPQLAEASRLTEAMRRHDTSYQEELSWWTAPFETSEGVPYSALTSAADQDRVDIARRFPAGNRPSRPGPESDQSVIAVLCTDGDSRREALGCGEVLSDVLLEATMAGLATCTLSHMTELDASRDIIRTLVGGPGDPQLLIRIGMTPPLSDPPAPTPRRPLAGVLEIKEVS